MYRWKNLPALQRRDHLMSARDRLDPPLSIDQPKSLRIVPHDTADVSSLFSIGPARSNEILHLGIEDMLARFYPLDVDGEVMVTGRSVMIIRESERELSRLPAIRGACLYDALLHCRGRHARDSCPYDSVVSADLCDTRYGTEAR